MDNRGQIPPLIRLLSLNTELYEMRSELLRQPVSSGRIAELQDGIDRCHRASLTTCWLTEGYELDDDSGDSGREYYFDG